MATNSRLLADWGEAVERGLPGGEVADRVLDMQGGHEGSICSVDVAHGRREGFSCPSQIPGVWRDTSHVAVSASRGRSRERIMRLCGSLADARTLRLELLEELRQM